MTYCWVDAIAGRATWPRSEADTEIMNTGRAHNPEINIYGVFCRHVIRRRWWVIAMTLIGLSASIWAAAERLTIDTSLKTFMRSDAAAKEVLDAYRAEFGRDDVFMIVVEGDVFTPLFMKRLRALHTGNILHVAYLVALGASGPAVGRVLEVVRAAHLDGKIQNREEALALARELLRRRARG